jgi:uncharacterized membrane protein YphA (DoxX/SURF4 family)
VWRLAAGDPDQQALAHLEVEPLADTAERATDKPHTRLPPALKKDWDAYAESAKKHYELDETQVAQWDTKRGQAAAVVVNWLTYVPPMKPDDQARDPNYVFYTSEQTRTFPSGEVKRRMGMKERIDEYKAKLAAVRDSSNKMWQFGKDVEGAKLRAEKAEVARLRTGLMTDLDKKTQEMKQSLDGILTPEQKELAPVPEAKGRQWVEWLDWLTAGGLVVIGAGLMLGLFTRLNAWLAAGFLLLTILAMPSLPWLPAAPMSEGNYLVVNKNVVEMLALCVLATTYSGRWFGIDGLLYHGWCWITGKCPER